MPLSEQLACPKTCPKTLNRDHYRKVSYASPFGGYKHSGMGRENGLESMREYTQVKSVWVDTGNIIEDPFRVL